MDGLSRIVGERITGTTFAAPFDTTSVREFRREFENSQCPYLILDPRPGLHIIDINDA